VRIVLGIGNPGKKYLYTRHNAGFLLLDYFAEKNKLNFKASKLDYYYAEGKTGNAGFSLIKPSTYVNNSGIAALQALQKYDAGVQDLLVLNDDVNLPAADVRIKAFGGDGGHNGLKSIIYHLNSNEFPRIRIGIGADFEKGEMADYVLSTFSEDDFKLLKDPFDMGCILIEEFIKGGVKQMLDANSRLAK
jgi:PTH1 family peptidyl-tRNA hydrolase